MSREDGDLALLYAYVGQIAVFFTKLSDQQPEYGNSETNALSLQRYTTRHTFGALTEFRYIYMGLGGLGLVAV